MNKLKLLVIFMLILIVCLPFTQAQACTISLRKDDIGKVIDELKTKLPSDFSDEKMTYFIRRSFEKEFIKLSQSFGLDEEYPLSYIEYISDRPLEDLIISFNVLTELRIKYSITDEEIVEGIKNKNLLEIVKDKAERDIENDVKDIEEVKTLSEKKSSVSSPLLVSSVLAMTLILSTIIKSNVATNEAIGRELAMGSKASVSVVVNAPSTEVSQEEQTQETIEDFIPAQEPEIQGAPSLEGDDYEKYNKIVPILNKVSSEMNFDPLILASIVLTESLGDANARRYETNRYSQIKSAYQANPKYKEHYEKLKKEGLVKNEEEYFQTMSSYDRGLTQIAPATAVAYTSWRGHPYELYNPETNLRVIIDFLRNRGFKETDTGLQGALTANTIVNTNSRTGTPVEGHLERAEGYYEELEKQSDLNNKGIRCDGGSTRCTIKTKDVQKAKQNLYDAFEIEAKRKGITIKSIDKFFTKEEIIKGGIILETDFEVDDFNEFENKYSFKLEKVIEEFSNLEKSWDPSVFALLKMSSVLEKESDEIGSPRYRIIDAQYTEKVNSIGLDVEHTINYVERIGTRIPNYVLDKIKSGSKISLHLSSTSQAIASMKKRGFNKFVQIKAVKEATTWKLWVAVNNDNEVEYFVSDIRGTSRLNHVEAMLKLSGIDSSQISVYDYDIDYVEEFKKSLDDIVDDEIPNILIMGDQSSVGEYYLKSGFLASTRLKSLQEYSGFMPNSGQSLSDLFISIFNIGSVWFENYYSKKVTKSLINKKIIEYLKTNRRTEETRSILDALNNANYNRDSLVDILTNNNIPQDQISAILDLSNAESKQQLYDRTIRDLQKDIIEYISSQENFEDLMAVEPDSLYYDKDKAEQVLKHIQNLFEMISVANLNNEFLSLGNKQTYFERIVTPQIPFNKFRIKTVDGIEKTILLTSNPYGILSGSLTAAALKVSKDKNLEEIIFLGAGGGLQDIVEHESYFPVELVEGDVVTKIPNVIQSEYKKGILKTDKPVRLTRHGLVDTVFEETRPVMKGFINQGIQTLEVEVGHVVKSYLSHIDSKFSSFNDRIDPKIISRVKESYLNGDEIDDDLLLSLGITDSSSRNDLLLMISKITRLGIIQHTSDLPLVLGKTLEDLGFWKPPALEKDKYINLLFNHLRLSEVLERAKT